MITLHIAEARMKRQLIEKQAGSSFIGRADIVARIPYLSRFDNEQFLFGIYDSENKWTVLSVNSLYGAYDSEPFVLRIDEVHNQMHNYIATVGTKSFSDVVLENGNKVWMKSVGLSCSIRNIVLMLENLPYGTVLAD